MRTWLLINPDDMRRQGLIEGDMVTLIGDAGDDVRRFVGGYHPEMNPLIPLWHHDQDPKMPASKGVPVRIARAVTLQKQ